MYYRLYVSQEFLGLIFNLLNCNVSRQINYLQPLLLKTFKIPTLKIKLTEEELTEENLIAVFVDATEQQIQRPKKDRKSIIPKKKAYMKNKIVIDNNEKIFSVTKSISDKKHD